MKNLLLFLLLTVSIAAQAQNKFRQPVNFYDTIRVFKGAVPGRILQCATDSGSARWVTAASVFSLTNGSGTTANGTAVDLGGTISQNTYLNFNPKNYEFLIGDANSHVLLRNNDDVPLLKVLDLKADDLLIQDSAGNWSIFMYNTGDQNSGITSQHGRDTTYISFGTNNVFEYKNGKYFRGYAGFQSASSHVSNVYVSEDEGGNDMANVWAEFDTATGRALVKLYVRKDTASSRNMFVKLNNNGLKFYDDTDSVFAVDTFGIVTFGSLDSVTIYAITPSGDNGKVYCNNCTGNGVTGRYLSYVGGAWRRDPFE